MTHSKTILFPGQETNSSGFTLIEVLIAIVVFSVGLLALSALQTSAIRGNSSAYSLTDTTLAASSRLENILAAKYDSSLLSAGNHTVQDGGYIISYSVNETTPNMVKRINLNISRTDLVTKTYSYSVVVTNLP